MSHKRSAKPVQGWDQLDLLGGVHGVGGRQPRAHAQPGGGGYLNECSPSEVAGGARKNFAKFSRNLATGEKAGASVNPREAALLDELDAIGVSRVMLRVAHAIGFDNFMVMWRILDGAHETYTDNESGICLRMQRLAAYRRYQRNRFIEALASIGMTNDEIQRAVWRELGEKVSDRHTRRLMVPGRVRP